MAVTIEREGAVSIIRLDRPAKLNAFDRDQYAGMNRALAEFEADDAARVGIVTSTSPRAFSVGVDLDDLSRAVSEERLRGDEMSQAFALTIADEGAVTKPMIAAIPGYCVGEGFGLALYCDLRVAADDAVFSLPEAKVGITTVRVTVRLPQVIGLGNAMELLLTGARKDAEWALRVGLVNAVVPPERLLETARAMADEIVSSNPRAIRNVRQLALAALSIPEEEAIAIGMEMRRRTPRAETAAGTRSFHERKTTD